MTPGKSYKDRDKGYVALIGKLQLAEAGGRSAPNPKIPTVVDRVSKTIAGAVDLGPLDLDPGRD